MKLHKINEENFSKIIRFVFFCTFLIISFCVIILAPFLQYTCKKNFLFPNGTLLIIDIFILMFFYILCLNLKRFGHLVDKYAFRLILVGSIILFISQVCISYNIYFRTGWDVGTYIIPAVKMILEGKSLSSVNEYFSMYPNNITLVWILSKILRFNLKIGIFGRANELMPIVIVNCLISSLSSILTYKCVEGLINKKWAIFSWIIYFLLIGISPWFVITYSDSLTLFLPILMFFVYTREVKGKWMLLKWLLIGIIGFGGYYIKPQVIIMLIAIVIVEMWKFVFLIKARKKEKYFAILMLISAFLLSNIFYKTIILRQTGFNINTEASFGWTHFAMMGLNTEMNGIYWNEDVAFSKSFSTLSQRRRANIQVIRKRLKNFGIVGYAKFMIKKILVNYGDGTFAWSLEGNFYSKTYKDKNNWLSPVLKSFYYSSGGNYGKTSTFEQAIWIGIIVSMLGLILIKKEYIDSKIAILMLSILGLTAFELLFEARARYLYIYAPVYISLSMLGLKNTVHKAMKLKQYVYLKHS